MKLEVSKKTALKEYMKAGSEGRDLLESLFGPEALKVDVMKDIKCFDDILDLNDMDVKSYTEELQGLPLDEQSYRSLKLIVATYNQGWRPNWADVDEPKYFPWFDVEDLLLLRVGISDHLGGYANRGANAGPVAVLSYNVPSDSSANRGSRLAFKKREHAIRAGELFAHIYADWMVG